MKSRFVCLASILASASIAHATQPVLGADVQIQAQKSYLDITNPKNKDNLSDLWGRFNLNAKVTEEQYQAVINLRVYPENFGYEVLNSATVKEVNDSVQLVQSKSKVANFQAEQAWINLGQSTGAYFKMGRWLTSTMGTSVIGNLLDQDLGASIFGRIAYHNAVEFGYNTTPFKIGLMLEAGDTKLNTGMERLFAQLNLGPSTKIVAGYRTNATDSYANDKSLREHRSTLGVSQQLAGLTLGAEAGIISPKGSDEYSYPAMAFVNYPWTTGQVLKLECGYQNDRQVSKVDQPLLYALFSENKITDRLKIFVSVHSDPAGKYWTDSKFATRLQATLW